jgi:activator of 2-hydroxyglutaryl-CoA dehydratase/predicted nucleotide-binding protein (sugar kinase/HSP70/actin superfamily)
MDAAVGLDIGSTTVKVVLLRGEDRIIWKRYARHRSLQAETVLAFLEECRSENGLDGFRLFTTGSGGGRIAQVVGAKHFQEVNALCSAVERLHGDVGSVFEIGGQDSKFITWREGRGKFSAMNDRCAGGTGATIDRIVMKLNLSEAAVRAIPYDTKKVYPVAGKCGVFAETDINSLQKQGIPEDALIVSLFSAVVGQNLAVLARGHTPLPDVLLLGGPNVFLPGLREAWRCCLASLWDERGIVVEGARMEISAACSDNGPGVYREDLGGTRVYAPENALYYGALGAVFMGLGERDGSSFVRDFSPLVRFIEGRKRGRTETAGRVFFNDLEERKAFIEEYARTGHGERRIEGGGASGAPTVTRSKPQAEAHPFPALRGYVGIDGGSTSTKGVILDPDGGLVASAYKLSEGNPLADARDILFALKDSVESACGVLGVAGIGYTGYAKDLLFDAFGGTAAIVETVAHTLGALKYFPDAEVICDVGGQDIKVIILKKGVIKDFRLNTQCSAGNGYYLQSTAGRFGYPIDRYAEAAFAAERAPVFNFGCAVFLESDIVNFQQLGWQSDEIMAGLARVVPQNVWLYVVQEANLARLGRVFVLQGGTHNNLAVVKSQVDFIRSRVSDARIHLHPHREVAGAIGAALEAMSRATPRGADFIGFNNLKELSCSAKRNEETRCGLCRNACLRTMITVQAGTSVRSFIIAQCERGSTDGERRRTGMEGPQGRAPNFMELSNRSAFRRSSPSPAKRPRTLEKAVIGIPRVLNIYSTASFFRNYFEHLGAGAVCFSPYTSERLYMHTLGRGSIDPCFPSKVAISHVYDLLLGERVTHIFFPCLRTLRSEITTGEQHWSCPAVSATPEVVKASLTLEKDEFARRGVLYLDPVLDMAEWDVLERQMYGALRPVFHIGRRENRDALQKALVAWDTRMSDLRRKAEEALIELERTGGTGIVALGRPYHNDPGINHGVLEQLNRRGYPIFSIESLPRNGLHAERLFGREMRVGAIAHPLDIRDVWRNCFSENTSLKVWAAKFAARHPNLVAIDISSFRCGHDAPLHSVIDDIFMEARSPYFTFHEIDENKPLGSIKLRVETIDYFLSRQYRRLKRPDDPRQDRLQSCGSVDPGGGAHGMGENPCRSSTGNHPNAREITRCR